MDFLELSAPDLLSTVKGIEIECTAREKQINYNKWQTNKLFFLSEAQASGVSYIDKDFLDVVSEGSSSDMLTDIRRKGAMNSSGVESKAKR